jgi:thiopeptide-type bacteriocin biosynthesis protein
VDFGLDVKAKLRLAEQSRDDFAQRYRFELLRERLADRLRHDRPALQRLLESPADAPEELEPGLAHLTRRSAANAGIVKELQALERRGQLAGRVTDLLPSCVHMYVNRLSRSAGPEHELVLYDYLAQLYRSQLARSAKGTQARSELVAAGAG